MNRLDPEIEIRWDEDEAVDRHGVPRECTASVINGEGGEETISYAGKPSIVWRGRLCTKGCHILHVLAENHLSSDPPYVVAFHSQPTAAAPVQRRSRRNRR